MSDRELFSGLLAPRFFPGWAELLLPRIAARLQDGSHGDWPRWRALVQNLPDVAPSAADFAADTVSLGRDGDCDRIARQACHQCFLMDAESCGFPGLYGNTREQDPDTCFFELLPEFP